MINNDFKVESSVIIDIIIFFVIKLEYCSYIYIRNSIAPTLHPATLAFLDKEAYIKNVLFGSKNLSSEENILIFKATISICCFIWNKTHIAFF